MFAQDLWHKCTQITSKYRASYRIYINFQIATLNRVNLHDVYDVECPNVRSFTLVVQLRCMMMSSMINTRTCEKHKAQMKLLETLFGYCCQM